MVLDPLLKKEINAVIPDGAKVGEVFVIPNKGVVQIIEALSDTVVSYTFYNEPADMERVTKEAAKIAKKAVEEVKSKPFIIGKPFIVR